MSKVTAKDLQELMGLLVTSLKGTLEADIADKVPTDAATLGIVTKLLKDNDIAVEPADQDDLGTLRDKLAAASRARKEKAGNVIDLVKQDLAREA